MQLENLQRKVWEQEAIAMIQRHGTRDKDGGTWALLNVTLGKKRQMINSNSFCGWVNQSRKKVIRTSDPLWARVVEMAQLKVVTRTMLLPEPWDPFSTKQGPFCLAVLQWLGHMNEDGKPMNLPNNTIGTKHLWVLARGHIAETTQASRSGCCMRMVMVWDGE